MGARLIPIGAFVTRLALALLASLALAACAPGDKRSDDNHFSGWYAGAAGGMGP